MAEEIVINTHLAGTRRFIAEAKQITGSILEMAAATRTAGNEVKKSNNQSFLWKQTLFTLRRILYGVTLTLIGAGGAALKMGYEYNTAIQSARAALQPFFGDAKTLTDSLNQLWTIAKYSPFQIQDMTVAFGKMAPAMLNLGMTGQDVTRILKDLTDALTVGMAGRVTPEALNRASVALQHLAYTGQLTGMSVLQLARDGVPIYAALNKELGLTTNQMHEVGKLGIPAQVALQAIQKYIETTPGYIDAARRISTHSVSGLWSTFKDNISQTMGMAEKGWFKTFQHILVRMNNFFNELQGHMKHTHNLFKALDQTLTPQSHMIINLWNHIVKIFFSLWAIVKKVGMTVLTNKAIWTGVGVAAWILAQALSVLSGIIKGLGPLITPIITLLVLYKTYLWLTAENTVRNTVATVSWKLALKILNPIIAAVTKKLGIYTTATRLASIWTDRFIKGPGGRFQSFSKLEKAFLKLRDVIKFQVIPQLIAMDAASWSNPYVILAAAILVVIAAAVYMMVKWKQVHEFIKRHNWILYIMGFISPFLVLLYEIRDHWNQLRKAWDKLWADISPVVKPIINAFKQLAHYIERTAHYLEVGWHWLTKWPSWLGGPSGKSSHGGGGLDIGNIAKHFGEFLLHGMPIPSFQSGGSMVRSGWAVVGESGPEMVHLPAGAAVYPSGSTHVQPININFTAELKVDGRKMAQVVARHQTSVNARM